MVRHEAHGYPPSPPDLHKVLSQIAPYPAGEICRVAVARGLCLKEWLALTVFERDEKIIALPLCRGIGVRVPVFVGAEETAWETCAAL